MTVLPLRGKLSRVHSSLPQPACLRPLHYTAAVSSAALLAVAWAVPAFAQGAADDAPVLPEIEVIGPADPGSAAPKAADGPTPPAAKPAAKKSKAAAKKPKTEPDPMPPGDADAAAVVGGAGSAGGGEAPSGVAGDGVTGVVGYMARGTSTATKTATPLIDVPQAVSVITRERADDQRALDIGKALQFVPGVIVAQGEGNRDQIVIRGQNTTADFFVDGVRDDVQYFRDLYNADRIEVLKGSNAMIFGRGGGGGVVNRVTKKADGERIYEGMVSAGSFDHKRISADAGQAVTNDFAVRLNGVYEDSGSFRDGVDLERYGINPTAGFRPTEATRVWLSYEYFSDERTADRGIASLAATQRPYPGSISAFFGDPDLSRSDFAGHNATATVEHRFSEALKIRNHTYYGDFDKFYQNVFAATSVNAGGTFGVDAYNNTLIRDTFVNQTDLTYVIDGGWWGHTIVVGTEFSRQNSHSFRFNGVFDGPGGTQTRLNGVPANDPTIDVPISFTQAQSDSETGLRTASAYVQDQFDITKYVQVIGGVRFDRFDLDATNVLTSTEFGRVDDVWSPRVGVVVKPVETLSFYASYSKSFLPYSGDQFASLDATTAGLEPEEFPNREIGLKWDLSPRLMFQAALYRLDRENTRTPDPNNPGFVIQTGSSRTEGAEIELVGHVTDAWQIAAGYARTFAEITSAQGTGATPTPAGRELANVPSDIFTLWNRYQLTSMFGVGLGIVHRSEMFASLNNTTVLPSFTRLDGALFVDLTESVELQLNVENILDETYYVSSHTDNNISPGAPLSAYVTLKAKF